MRLDYRPPLAWHALLDFLRRRAVTSVETIDDDSYARTIRLGQRTGVIRVADSVRRNALELVYPAAMADELPEIVWRARALFDLDHEPAAVSAAFANDPELGWRAGQLPGLRVPGAWEPLEVGVRAIVGQQVSVKGATTLMGRLAHALGDPLPAMSSEEGPPLPGLTHLFPGARTLAETPAQGIGLTGARVRAIQALAQAFLERPACIEDSPDAATAIRDLRTLPGVGRWTAEYMVMRGRNARDVFLAGDLVARKALASADDPDALPSEKAVRLRAEAWQPWRSYALLYLWTVRP